jgi:hypothetical protein
MKDAAVTMLTNPLIVMFEADGKLVCHLHPPKGSDHKSFGLAICDLIRHVANAFNVHEDEVFDWIEKERRNPTTEITRAS